MVTRAVSNGTLNVPGHWPHRSFYNGIENEVDQTGTGDQWLLRAPRVQRSRWRSKPKKIESEDEEDEEEDEAAGRHENKAIK